MSSTTPTRSRRYIVTTSWTDTAGRPHSRRQSLRVTRTPAPPASAKSQARTRSAKLENTMALEQPVYYTSCVMEKRKVEQIADSRSITPASRINETTALKKMEDKAWYKKWRPSWWVLGSVIFVGLCLVLFMTLFREAMDHIAR